MRVVHYSTRLGRSGGGLYHSVSGLARGMAGLGAEITVVGGTEKGFADERHVWGDLSLIGHSLGRQRYGFSPDILGAITRLEPDILHIHGIWSASSIYGRFASKNTRLVVSPRGMLDPWILQRKPLVKHGHAALFERPMLARAHVHALSAHEADCVRAFMPTLSDRVFTVPNGIHAAPGRSPARKGALFLGRLHEKKQVLKLIDAWETHGKSLKLTIAGWGAADYEAQVAARCQGKQRVRFAGGVHDEAKAEALATAEFFILPSLSEGLPMAALEALAAGSIPILTEACHLPELFANDISIRMEADFSDFAGVLERLRAMTGSEKARRSAKAREAAEAFLWPGIARRMLDHYSAILEGPAP
ncbi:hypothetical protein VW35_19440 [Devosia soli]|uniref:Glycosyltransferase subfamily 4-like N-terminal domain-containing protein n=1 Tax=Devosia soli TaxID=361041 RepID=A0A0F5L2R5_9HYPH|nr:glycosyltransferase [Devosia soli]KKB75922.1 hypothetical protein VW35_19440 [Devosia soli]